MEWHEVYKVGDKVRVVKKVLHWEFDNGGGCSWAFSGLMDNTIGNVYEIIGINLFTGYQLKTRVLVDKEFNEYMDYWYPLESLSYAGNYQLELPFMNEE